MYVYLSIKFCLSNSSSMDTNSFLTPVFPAALLASSISNLSTSAIGSHDKMMVGTEGGIPFPAYRSFSFQIGFNMCFHFQLLLAFGLVSLSSLFLLKAFCWMHYFSIIIIWFWTCFWTWFRTRFWTWFWTCFWTWFRTRFWIWTQVGTPLYFWRSNSLASVSILPVFFKAHLRFFSKIFFIRVNVSNFNKIN